MWTRKSSNEILVCEGMKKEVILVVVVIVLLALSWLGVDYMSAMKSYDKLREESNSPILQSVEFGYKEQVFLDHVKNSWVMLGDRSPDDGLLGFCRLLGFEQTVAGLVDFCTHEIPPFSFSDKEQNIREAGRAGALSQVPSISVDKKIYYKEGVAYLRVRDDIINYYEDTEDGIKSIFYGKVKKAE